MFNLVTDIIMHAFYILDMFSAIFDQVSILYNLQPIVVQYRFIQVIHFSLLESQCLPSQCTLFLYNMRLVVGFLIMLSCQRIHGYMEDYCLDLPVETLKQHIFRKFELPDGRRVLVLDNIIQEDRHILLRQYLNVNDNWR